MSAGTEWHPVEGSEILKHVVAEGMRKLAAGWAFNDGMYRNLRGARRLVCDLLFRDVFETVAEAERFIDSVIDAAETEVAGSR